MSAICACKGSNWGLANCGLVLITFVVWLSYKN